jgi:hypothetical protein
MAQFMAQKTAQTQNATRRYAICTICHAHNVERPQWRVYEIDVTPRGQFYRGALLYAAHTEEEALKWARENCWNIFSCI